MAKVLGFKIEIQGTQAAVETATDVRLAISEINKALKTTTDPKEYEKLEQELLKLKGTLNQVNREQRQSIKEFEATSEGVSAYAKLNAQLSVAKQKYKDLAAAGKENTDEAQKFVVEAKRIDDRLKEIDGNVGQFTRNVGNYPTTVNAALTGSFPILGQFDDLVSTVGETTSRTGKLIAGAFAAFAIASTIAEGAAQVKEFVDEFKEARRQVTATTGAINEELDKITTKLKATSETFKVDFQESLNATNAVIQTFGTEGVRAADLVSDALLGVADRSKFLGLVEEELKKLVGIGIDDQSALALLVEASNQNFNVDVLTEPLIALREQTPATVEALENAFGKERTEQLFKTFGESPIEAIKQISQEFNGLDDRSKESGAILADVFKAAGEDNLSAVKNIANINSSLEVLIENAGAAAEEERKLRDVNEELAAAQNEVTKKFEEASGGFDILKKRAQLFLVQGLLRLLEIFSPLVDAFKTWGQEIGKIINRLGIFQGTGNKTNIILKLLFAGINNIVFVLTQVVKFSAFVINAFTDLIDTSPKLQKAMQFIGDAIRGLINVATNLPAVFAGIRAEAANSGIKIKAFFQQLAIDAQILQKRIEKLNPFGKTSEQIDNEIQNLKQRKKDIAATGKDFGVAYSEAFAKALEDGQKKVEEASPQPTEPTVTGSGKRPTNKKQQNSKELSKQQAVNDKLLAEEVKFGAERVELIKELGKRVLQATIDNIEDKQEQERKAEDARHKENLAQLTAQQTAIAEKIKEQENKLTAAFGTDSQQVIAFRQKSGADLLQIQEQFHLLEQQEEERHRQKKGALQKKFDEDEAKQRIQALQKQIDSVTTAADISLSKIEEARAKALTGIRDEKIIFEINARFNLEQFEVDKAEILAQLKELNAAIELEEALQGTGVSVNAGEFDQLLSQRQKLNEQLAKLEQDYTATVQEEGDKRLQQFATEVAEIAGYVNQGLDIFNEFASASHEKEIAQLDEQQQLRENNISELEEQISGATESERIELKKRLKNEQKALDEVNKSREEKEKEFAKKQKAIAIIQSVINGIVAVTKALANPPGPPFSIPQAVAAGAFAAVQTAAIAAQPLAEGGKVTPVEVAGGKVVAAQNIPTLKNGDDVLATLKRGEVVLNQNQQKLLGGAPVFRSIGVPGFADGGIVDTPITAPRINLANSDNKMIDKLDAKTDAIANQTRAINNRTITLENKVVNLKVFLDEDELLQSQAEQENLTKKATLS